uniref:Uncharacterized protein n=1 Tax=Plectus sambesii TaxID=2011161 RepID=A0A914V5S8_9BILA
MEELSTEETKTIDAEWKEFQIIHGIPKSESQVKYTSPNIIMLDESEKSRGFGGRWWFAISLKMSEKIFAQLLNKPPDITDEYVKSAEAFSYIYDKTAQERMKRKAITGIDNVKDDCNGNSCRYCGPSTWSRQINQTK